MTQREQSRWLALPCYPDNVWREPDIAWVLAHLATSGKHRTIWLSGVKGSGKTSIVAGCLSRIDLHERFEDGVVFLACDPYHDEIEVIRNVLALADPHGRRPETSDLGHLQRAARRLLNANQLIVLDGLRTDIDIETIAATLSDGSALVLGTTDGAIDARLSHVGALRRLAPLTQRFVGDILLRITTGKGSQTQARFQSEDRGVLADVIANLNRYPLDIKLASAYVAVTACDWQSLGSEVRTQTQRMKALGHRETDARTEALIASLTRTMSPDSLALFVGLSELRGRVFAKKSALAVGTALNVASVDGAIDEMLARGLVDTCLSLPREPDDQHPYFIFHPKVQQFASHLELERPSNLRRVVKTAIAIHFSQYTHQEITEKMLLEEESIYGALEWAQASGQAKVVRDICAGLQNYWRDSWRTTESTHYFPWAVEAADAIANESGRREELQALADLSLNYGLVLRRLGKHAEAISTFSKHLKTQRVLHNRQGEGIACAKCGNIALRCGQVDVAEMWYQEALIIAQEVGDRTGESEALRYLGRIAQRRGLLNDCERYYRVALEIAREVHDIPSETWILAYLGAALQASGRYDEASRSYEEAQHLACLTHDRQLEGFVLSFAAELQYTLGDRKLAENLTQESIDMLYEVNDRPTLAYVLIFLGQLRQETGDHDESLRLFLNSLGMFRELADSDGVSLAEQCLNNLGPHLTRDTPAGDPHEPTANGWSS